MINLSQYNKLKLILRELMNINNFLNLLIQEIRNLFNILLSMNWLYH